MPDNFHIKIYIFEYIISYQDYIFKITNLIAIFIKIYNSSILVLLNAKTLLTG